MMQGYEYGQHGREGVNQMGELPFDGLSEAVLREQQTRNPWAYMQMLDTPAAVPTPPPVVVVAAAKLTEGGSRKVTEANFTKVAENA